jgi:formylglycine-generating enzyme required for sulfatase activity
MRRPPDDGGGEATARWCRLEELLAATLELPVEARQILLDRECEGDAPLRAELDALLAAHDQPGILDQPVALWDDLAGARAGGLAPGAIVTHYELQEQLGRGGMGVVYRARDLRHERTVALKFLAPALSADEQAKRRFLAEARAAAALEHVNVCTFYEAGQTDTGQLFIAMAFVEGESLRRALERGPLGVRQAVEIARQVASALKCTHGGGIVHRDVKPANVMLGVDGVVKLVDFGVAKLEGLTLTGAGTTPGTTAYMSPEQARGTGVDHRTDLWALGVLLYEMLVGKRPFAGGTEAATLHAITAATPTPLLVLRTDLPAELDHVIARALSKERERRFQSADEMLEALCGVEDAGAAALPVPLPGHRAPARFPAAVALALLVATLSGAALWQRVASRRALASLPRIAQLAEQESYVEAYAMAASVEGVLERDTTLQRLLRMVAERITIVSRPSGAHAWLRQVAIDGSLGPDSVLVGQTPVSNLRVARGEYRLDLRKDGFAPAARIVSSALHRSEASAAVPAGITIEVALREADQVPEGMVFVAGSPYALIGRETPSGASVTPADFLIDAHEVTNEQFREFVVLGGYANPRYWRNPFVQDGRTQAWSAAVRRFVDRTGLPGPRGWTWQEFPPGEARRPVTGVTWYEAAAYAEFVGKRLPTVFEWEKAARDGRSARSHPSGLSPFGAHNMADTVAEWLATPNGTLHVVAGGGASKHAGELLSVSGFYASASLGFRCARDAALAAGVPSP